MSSVPREADGEAEWGSHSAALSFRLLRERHGDLIWKQLLPDVLELLDATVVEGFRVLGNGDVTATGRCGAAALPPEAALIARALLRRAVVEERSLSSADPRLDADLRSAAVPLRSRHVVRAILYRSGGVTHGATCVYWIDRPLPADERLAGFVAYQEHAALALALAAERRRLHGAAGG